MTFNEAEEDQKEMLKKINEFKKKITPQKGYKPSEDNKKRMEELEKEVKDVYKLQMS